jgi:hypothetical protein
VLAAALMVWQSFLFQMARPREQLCAHTVWCSGYAACEVGVTQNGTCPTSVSTGQAYLPLSEYLEQPACSTDLSAYELKVMWLLPLQG